MSMNSDSPKKLTGREQALANAEHALRKSNFSWADLHAKGKLRGGVIVVDEDDGARTSKDAGTGQKQKP